MERRRDLFGWLGLASGLVALALALGTGAIAAQFVFTALVIIGFAVLTGAVLARYS